MLLTLSHKFDLLSEVRGVVDAYICPLVDILVHTILVVELGVR